MTPEQIYQLLQEADLRATPQRFAIVDFLVHTEAHPTADEVYEAIKGRLSACSKATIYNTLSTLANAGVIHAISIEPGVTRYDANMRPHHHFVDTDTGTVYDIPWESVQPLFGTLGGGFQVRDYQVNFYGDKVPYPPEASGK